MALVGTSEREYRWMIDFRTIIVLSLQLVVHIVHLQPNICSRSVRNMVLLILHWCNRSQMQKIQLKGQHTCGSVRMLLELVTCSLFVGQRAIEVSCTAANIISARCDYLGGPNTIGTTVVTSKLLKLNTYRKIWSSRVTGN